MTDISGIAVTPGVLPEQLRASLEIAVERIGGRIIDTVRIDTTHFVCTEGRGKDWERAVEMNIPVVRPEWVEGCEREGRIVGVRGYYLDANPKQRHVGANPSLSSTTASSSNVAVGAKGSQTNLPDRRVPPQPTPRSPDRESHITGEGNGPGPELPPTPPPKNDRRMSAVSAEAETVSPVRSSNTDDDEDEVSGPDEEREEARSPVKDSTPGRQAKRSEASMKARVEDEKEGEGSGNGEMEDVSL
jgi:chitin biosynthesis protein CHS5